MRDIEDTLQALTLPPLSRRREPRISVTGAVILRAGAPGAPDVLGVRDLSFRGFSIDTPGPVTPRTTARFAFQAAGIPPFSAVAVAVHCHRLQVREERWVSGWEFPEQPGLDAAIERLLDVAVGVLTIE